MGGERLARKETVHKPCDLLLLVCMCVCAYTFFFFLRFMYIIPLFASSVLQFGC